MPLALATEIMHSQTLLLLALNIVQTFIIIASFLLPALLSSNHSLLDGDNFEVNVTFVGLEMST